jgi:hypothetical protein
LLTAELVTLISQEVGAAWSRTLILAAINNVQNELLGTDNDISRVKPDPFMTTAAATYSYVATSQFHDSSAGTSGSLVGDVRSVRKIYSLSSSIDILGFTALEPGSARPYTLNRRGNWDEVEARCDFVQSKEPDSSDALIKWWEGNDPAATTIYWRGEVYLWPTQLLTESVALTMPADFHDSLLLEGVIKRIERREFGRNLERAQMYEFEKKRFRTKYSSTPNNNGPLVARPLDC